MPRRHGPTRDMSENVDFSDTLTDTSSSFLSLYSPAKPIPSDQSIAAPSAQPPPKPTPRRLHHKPDNLPSLSRTSTNLCKSRRGKKKKREEGRRRERKEEEERGRRKKKKTCEKASPEGICFAGERRKKKKKAELVKLNFDGALYIHNGRYGTGAVAGFSHILVEGDAQNVLAALNLTEEDFSIDGGLIDEVKVLFSFVVRVMFP
ncbi:hypothetical protein ACLB2K_055966 [Fragaria x ananassa]